jgi:hypothetical protein
MSYLILASEARGAFEDLHTDAAVMFPATTPLTLADISAGTVRVFDRKLHSRICPLFSRLFA